MPLKLEVELLQAIEENDDRLVATLLEAGADPNAGLFREPALSLAVRNGNEAILALLLQRGPFQCMQEQRGNTPKPQISTTMLLLRGSAIQVARICFLTWATRKAALSLPPGYLQTVGLYGSQYIWCIERFSLTSFYSTTSLRGRCLDPWVHVDTLLGMSSWHRIWRFVTRRIFPPLPIPWTTYLQDLVIGMPLRMFIDTIVITGRELLVKGGFLEQPRWSGNPPSGLDTNSWTSPAQMVFRSLLNSETVTEDMVLKLLQANMIVSQPCETSEVARNLLNLAISKCWITLTEYLLGMGTPVDQGASPSAKDLKWPALIQAITYSHRLSSDNIRVSPASYFDGANVLSYEDYWDLAHGKQVGTYARLVSSRRFRQLATSESSADLSICLKMLDVLRDSGADPLLTDDGEDVLSRLISASYSKDILVRMLNLWVEASASHAYDTESAPVFSMALHKVVNTSNPDLESLQILLEAGISPEWENEDGRTPLFKAGFMCNGTGAIEMLVKYGADPNNGGSKGYPPILRALQDASYEKFAFFLDRGADPNLTNDEGKSILQVVLELSHQVVVLKGQLVLLLISRGCTVYEEATQTSRAFITAARQFNSTGWSEAILDILLGQIPEGRVQQQLDAALIAACLENKHSFMGVDPFTVFYLLRAGAEPSSVKRGSDSLLHFICAFSWVRDHKYREDMRNLLRQQVLDINALGEDGKTPLDIAVQKGNRDFVLLLVEYGANPNLPDSETGRGKTPLQHLCMDAPGEYSICQGYSEITGDRSDFQYHGVRGQASWGFVYRGRQRNIQQSLESEEIFQALVEHGANLEVVGAQRQSLLMMASAKGNSIIAANILYQLGKDCWPEALLAVDADEKTALHLAAEFGDINTLKVLTHPEHLLVPDRNFWRLQAIPGEELSQRKMEDEDGRLATLQKMAKEEENYARDVSSVPASMIQHTIQFDAADDEGDNLKLTIGDLRRKDEERICLPNVSISDWTLSKQEEGALYPSRLLDRRLRNPLHYAAEKGHLEAVNFLLKYSHFSLDAEDVDAKKPADLALDNNFYDVYYLFENVDT